MLKKLFIAFAIVLSALVLFNSTALADDASNSTASAHVKYDLAYPGMLPDSPLYKLKLLRNKITTFLITDPNRRVDYYLLEADKGILATAMLIDKKEIPLAERTVLRAENNMTLLNNEFGRMHSKPSNAMFAKLQTASFKHQEVLVSLISRLPANQRKTFQQVLDFSKRNQAMVETLQKRSSSKWNLPDL